MIDLLIDLCIGSFIYLFILQHHVFPVLYQGYKKATFFKHSSTGLVTCISYLPFTTFDICIGKWVSANGKPCSTVQYLMSDFVLRFTELPVFVLVLHLNRLTGNIVIKAKRIASYQQLHLFNFTMNTSNPSTMFTTRYCVLLSKRQCVKYLII